jgi:hypothetical protein
MQVKFTDKMVTDTWKYKDVQSAEQLLRSWGYRKLTEHAWRSLNHTKRVAWFDHTKSTLYFINYAVDKERPIRIAS